jgi:antitoxin VapB
VQIPHEFELPGEDAVMRKVGNRLIIEPKVEKKSVLELLASWGPDEFPEVRDLPAEPVEKI